MFDSLVISIIAEFTQLRRHNALRSVFGRNDSLYRIDYTAQKRSRLIEASKYVDMKYREIFLTGVINAAIADRDFAILYNKHGRIYSATVAHLASNYVMMDGIWYADTYARTGKDINYVGKLNRECWSRIAWFDYPRRTDIVDDDELVVAAAYSYEIRNANTQRLIKIFEGGNRRQFGFTSRDPMQDIYSGDMSCGQIYIPKGYVGHLENSYTPILVARILRQKNDSVRGVCKKITIALLRLYIAITIHEIDGLVDSDTERFLREKHEALFPHYIVDRSKPLYDF